MQMLKFSILVTLTSQTSGPICPRDIVSEEQLYKSGLDCGSACSSHQNRQRSYTKLIISQSNQSTQTECPDILEIILRTDRTVQIIANPDSKYRYWKHLKRQGCRKRYKRRATAIILRQNTLDQQANILHCFLAATMLSAYKTKITCITEREYSNGNSNSLVTSIKLASLKKKGDHRAKG